MGELAQVSAKLSWCENFIMLIPIPKLTLNLAPCSTRYLGPKIHRAYEITTSCMLLFVLGLQAGKACPNYEAV